MRWHYKINRGMCQFGRFSDYIRLVLDCLPIFSYTQRHNKLRIRHLNPWL
jgi:hypothetical protein